jgi:hypothetical protein
MGIGGKSAAAAEGPWSNPCSATSGALTILNPGRFSLVSSPSAVLHVIGAEVVEKAHPSLPWILST